MFTKMAQHSLLCLAFRFKDQILQFTSLEWNQPIRAGFSSTHRLLQLEHGLSPHLLNGFLFTKQKQLFSEEKNETDVLASYEYR